MKSLYRHKQSGDIFAIETDEAGHHVDKPEEYKDLVDEPRFQCHFCGRTAHNAESLCMPMDL